MPYTGYHPLHVSLSMPTFCMCGRDRQVLYMSAHVLCMYVYFTGYTRFIGCPYWDVRYAIVRGLAGALYMYPWRYCQCTHRSTYPSNQLPQIKDSSINRTLPVLNTMPA